MKSETFNKEIHPKQTRRMKIWLVTCIIAVVLMVFIGGVTRLTESGLSIVEWKLVSGTLPPLSQEAWQAEFAEYQTSPEFRQKNHYFTLSDFKRIYWLEYIHRLMGRITGMIFLLPLIYFAARRQLPKLHLKRMLGISALVGLQGAVGWIMVQSGLMDLPRVHPIKLALHLLIACSIFASLLITYWQLTPPEKRPALSPTIAPVAKVTLTFFVIQLILGAFVAATDAGYNYNTYPLMNGQLVPDGLLLLEPSSRNFIENITTIQFAHRTGAVILLLAVIWLATTIRKSPAANHYQLEAGRLSNQLLAIMALQFTLGVATLLSVVALPLASLHQLVALALLAAILRSWFLSKSAA